MNGAAEVLIGYPLRHDARQRRRRLRTRELQRVVRLRQVLLATPRDCRAWPGACRSRKLASAGGVLHRVVCRDVHASAARQRIDLDGGRARRVLFGLRPDPEFCDLWRAPAEVWDDGGGDCDDLALFAGSLALACGLDNTWLVIGTWNGQGHAWIEGWEDGHFFHIEATSGVLSLCRPDGYVPSVHVSPLHGCVFSSRAA
jgi:hypothetical protein